MKYRRARYCELTIENNNCVISTVLHVRCASMMSILKKDASTSIGFKPDDDGAPQGFTTFGGIQAYVIVVNNQQVVCQLTPSTSTSSCSRSTSGSVSLLKKPPGDRRAESTANVSSTMADGPATGTRSRTKGTFAATVMIKDRTSAIDSSTSTRFIAAIKHKRSLLRTRARCRSVVCQTDDSYVLECRIFSRFKSEQFLYVNNKSLLKKCLMTTLTTGKNERLLDSSLEAVLDRVIIGINDEPPLFGETEFVDGVTDRTARWCCSLKDSKQETSSLAAQDEVAGKQFKRKCPVCHKMMSKNYLSTHMRIHTSNRPYTCHVCKKQFTSASGIKQHLGTHDTNRERAHKCPHCDYGAFSKTALGIHMVKHDADQKLACLKCGKQFPNRRYLENHSKRHDMSIASICEICGKTYKDKATVEKHRRLIHEGIVKTYECKLCDKVFHHSTTFSNHRRRHIDHRPYKCETCGCGFTHNAVLKSHRLIHTGEKPHVCDICGRPFRQLVALRKHRYTHGASRPHRCDKCARQFIHRVYLTKHKCQYDAATT